MNIFFARFLPLDVSQLRKGRRLRGVRMKCREKTYRGENVGGDYESNMVDV
jgi:hypothetical protein